MNRVPVKTVALISAISILLVSAACDLVFDFKERPFVASSTGGNAATGGTSASSTTSTTSQGGATSSSTQSAGGGGSSPVTGPGGSSATGGTGGTGGAVNPCPCAGVGDCSWCDESKTQCLDPQVPASVTSNPAQLPNVCEPTNPLKKWCTDGCCVLPCADGATPCGEASTGQIPCSQEGNSATGEGYRFYKQACCADNDASSCVSSQPGCTECKLNFNTTAGVVVCPTCVCAKFGLDLTLCNGSSPTCSMGCADDQVACTADSECCSGKCNVGTTNKCCSETGGWCDDDGDCCSGTAAACTIDAANPDNNACTS